MVEEGADSAVADDTGTSLAGSTPEAPQGAAAAKRPAGDMSNDDAHDSVVVIAPLPLHELEKDDNLHARGA